MFIKEVLYKIIDWLNGQGITGKNFALAGLTIVLSMAYVAVLAFLVLSTFGMGAWIIINVTTYPVNYIRPEERSLSFVV